MIPKYRMPRWLENPVTLWFWLKYWDCREFKSLRIGLWRFSLYYTRECKRWPYRKTPECRSSWFRFLGWHLVAVETRRCPFNRVLQEENDMMVATFIHDYDRVYA